MSFLQLFKSYSTRYKQEVEICQLLAADLLKLYFIYIDGLLIHLIFIIYLFVCLFIYLFIYLFSYLHPKLLYRLLYAFVVAMLTIVNIL